MLLPYVFILCLFLVKIHDIISRPSPVPCQSNCNSEPGLSIALHSAPQFVNVESPQISTSNFMTIATKIEDKSAFEIYIVSSQAKGTKSTRSIHSAYGTKQAFRFMVGPVTVP